jgi:lipopolysaccharide biosynthesis glycosyltransferase
MIKKSPLCNETIKFVVNDTFDTIDEACKSRLDFFDFNVHYEKILYLDTDIIIKGNLKRVFDCCTEDILYVLEEGNLRNVVPCDYWGKQLFTKDELDSYPDTSAFSSGVILFKNCANIKELFFNIKKDIAARPHLDTFHDQPFIVYNSFKYNLFDNKILKSLVVNNEFNVFSDKVIHHFPGGPGYTKRKLYYLQMFLNECKRLM